MLRLDFVLPMGTNAFIKMLQQQLQLQGAARPDLDVEIHSIEGFNPDTLARTLQELRGRTQGVGVIALDHPTVREAIRALSASGVKVVTLASDILHVPRVAYVGIDNRAAGRLAGYVLGRFLGTAEPKKVALFAGSLSYRGHEEREMGFRHILSEEFPNLQIVELREMKDDREKAFVEATNLLERYADLAGIYNIGAGNQGIARALTDTKRAGSVVFVGHEATEGNKALLLDGTLDAVIDQNPRVEAREALNILARSARGLRLRLPRAAPADRLQGEHPGDLRVGPGRSALFPAERLQQCGRRHRVARHHRHGDDGEARTAGSGRPRTGCGRARSPAGAAAAHRRTRTAARHPPQRHGSQRPNTTSAMAIQPRPDTTPKVKALNCAIDRKAPATPISAPPSTTAWKRVEITLTPAESAARGFSPTMRSDRPHGVR